MEYRNDPIGIASRGAGVGYISWNSGKYFRGNLNYSVTVKKSENIDDRFLYYLLNKLQNEIFSLCTFEGIPALNASNLNKKVWNSDSRRRHRFYTTFCTYCRWKCY